MGKSINFRLTAEEVFEFVVMFWYLKIEFVSNFLIIFMNYIFKYLLQII